MSFKISAFLTTALPLLLAATASAQLPARDGASDQVGATPAEFRVDESGNATYSIPLYAVPGTAGVQPSLSLTYNSSSPDGLIGKGWSMGGMSAITRCRATREHGDFRDSSGQPVDGASEPIQFTSADRFCLDGQRLLLAPGTGAYGAVNSHYFPELDPFTRVILAFAGTSGQPNGFKVQRKDGSTSFYGNFNGCEAFGGACSGNAVANRVDALVYANRQCRHRQRASRSDDLVAESDV